MRSSSAQRDHLQGIINILYVCRKPQTMVQIIDETGLSMRHLHFCLKHLRKQNLVRLHYRKKTYEATQIGLRYLEQIQEPTPNS